jgi:hypothetical protein
MAEQRVTNMSHQLVYVNGTPLQHGESTYVSDEDGVDLRSTEGPVEARVIEWPDETSEVVINTI